MIKPKHSIAWLIFSSFVLIACTQPAEDPRSVADKYWSYLQTGNTVEAEKLVSVNSRRAIAEHSNRIASINQLNTGEATTTVSTTITTINPVSNYSHTETFDTVLVLQQGQWKVDANQSQIPPAPSASEEEMQQLAEELTESMQENIESIDDAMSEGMQLLNEALREGSKEMGDSLLNLMNELNSSMHESINKMKERRQQQLQEQQDQQEQPVLPPQLKPDPDKGEGMI